MALALLLRRRKTIVDQGLERGLAPAIIAHHIAHDLRLGIAEARALSRDAGLVRLKAEAATIDAEIAIGRAGANQTILRDLLRGRAAANAHAERWLKEAHKADGDVEAATEATTRGLRRIAITESSEAYNSGRLLAARESGLDLYRRWDAMADACPVCSDEDGTIVHVNDPFPIGEPGAVHPNCACDWELITAAEATLSRAA